MGPALEDCSIIHSVVYDVVHGYFFFLIYMSIAEHVPSAAEQHDQPNRIYLSTNQY